MSRLSEDVLNVGRRAVLDRDLPGLMIWVGQHAPDMTASEFESTYQAIFAEGGDITRGVKMFNQLFETYDPAFVRVSKKVLTWGYAAMVMAVFFGGSGILIWLAFR